MKWKRHNCIWILFILYINQQIAFTEKNIVTDKLIFLSSPYSPMIECTKHDLSQISPINDTIGASAELMK